MLVWQNMALSQIPLQFGVRGDHTPGDWRSVLLGKEGVDRQALHLNELCLADGVLRIGTSIK